MHIPRTGGMALSFALTGITTTWPHRYAIRPPCADRVYIVTLRDPVARFYSACAFRGVAPADADPSDMFFLPQVAWVGSAERLQESDILWVGRTEKLDDDFARLCSVLGVTRTLPAVGTRERNASTHATRSVAPAWLRDVCAADREVLV